MTQESTHTQGDSVEVTNVDTAAQALMARYEAHDETTQTETQAEQEDETTSEESTTESVEETEEAGTIESESTDASEEEAESGFQTVEELAEAVGMELDEFLNTITIGTKINGEEGRETLAKTRKGYQLESDYTRKNEAFLNQVKEWETQRDEKMAKLDAEFEKAGYAFQVAQQQLAHEFAATDWAKLEQEDKTQYLHLRQKFGERQAQLNQHIQDTIQKAQAYKDAQKAEADAKAETYQQEQFNLLVKAIPEWADDSVREKQGGEVQQYLLKQGFSPEEIATTFDHRIYLLARQAMQAKEAATEVDIAKKKVKKAPPLVKPNARQNVNQNAKTVAKLVKKAKETSRNEDIAAALLARRQ